MPAFWKLDAPHYSDYQHTFINGAVTHPFDIPGIRCDTCGQTWADAARVVPVECPPSVRPGFPEAPITLFRFHELRNIISTLAQCSPEILRPGTSLMPSSMAIPSRPEADFLWGSLGSLIVSERIKQSFSDAAFTGIVLLPITITKIGRRRAKLPAPIPDSGEPEDIMRLARDTPGPDVGQYFEMIVTADSRRVRGTEPTFVCGTCGFERWTPPQQWAMEESLWTGTDVFCLTPTSMVVVTDRVKQQLVQLGATNVRAIPIA